MTHLTQMPSLGETVDQQFILEQEIGHGSVGIVFEARRLDAPNERIALKILQPRIIAEHHGVERFEREARLASRLSNPHSIQIHGYGIHKAREGALGLPYIVMERLRGVDLQQYLDQRGALSIGETVGILLQALESLEEAHEKGIIHRDLKPGNVFLCKAESGEPKVKVLDYGMAKITSAHEDDPEALLRLTGNGMICGTPQCMAPEQAMGHRDLTPAVDVYAIGCLAYHMLVGRPMYGGSSKLEVARQHVYEAIPPMPDAYERSSIGQVLKKALGKEALQRYPSARMFAQALQEASEKDRIEIVGHDAAVWIAAQDELFDPYAEEEAMPEASGRIGVAIAVAAVIVVGMLLFWMVMLFK